MKVIKDDLLFLWQLLQPYNHNITIWNTVEHVLVYISAKERMVLNPWLSGRGAFPGRTEISTSRPKIRQKYNLRIYR